MSRKCTVSLSLRRVCRPGFHDITTSLEAIQSENGLLSEVEDILHAVVNNICIFTDF